MTSEPFRRTRTGLTAQLRMLEPGKSIFIREEATDANRISTTIARVRNSAGGEGKSFTALKVGGGYRVWRDR